MLTLLLVALSSETHSAPWTSWTASIVCWGAFGCLPLSANKKATITPGNKGLIGPITEALPPGAAEQKET